MPKVLIVEDDEVIAQGMARHLGAAGFDAVWVANGDQGLARLRYEKPDACVLDLMLPGLDGWKLIETVRAEGIGTPIIVVSARGTEHDRVHALEIGADDYLVKPFSMKELVARVRAAARRGIRRDEAPRGEPIEIEELRIDPREVQAYVDGESARLTPTEFRLLYQLALDTRPRLDARRAAAEAVGPPRVAPRPHRRRLRPAPAREDRPARVAAHVHPDALRRRLQARGQCDKDAAADSVTLTDVDDQVHHIDAHAGRGGPTHSRSCSSPSSPTGAARRTMRLPAPQRRSGCRHPCCPRAMRSEPLSPETSRWDGSTSATRSTVSSAERRSSSSSPRPGPCCSTLRPRSSRRTTSC